MTAPAFASYSSAIVQSSDTPSASIVVDKPTGTAEGDLLIACQAHTHSSSSLSHTAPSGWELVDSDEYASRAIKLTIWQKTAGSSEPSTYTFECGSAPSGGWSVVIGRFTHGDGSPTVDVVDMTATAGASNELVCPTVTTTADDALLLRGGARNGTGTATAPGGTTERWNVFSGTSSNSTTSVCATAVQASAGASGTSVWTTSSNRDYVSFSLALISPSGGDAGSGSVSGIGILEGAGQVSDGSGNVEGIGVIAGAGQATEGSGDVVGIGLIVGTGPVSEGSGSVVGIGVLDGAGESNDGSGSIIGMGSLTGSGSASEGSGTVIGIGVIEGEGAVPTGDGEGSGSIIGIGSLAGSGTAAEGSGSVVGVGLIVGGGSESAGSGSIIGIGSIDGTGQATEGSGVVVGVGLIVGTGATPTPSLPDPVTAEQAVYDMDQWWMMYVQMSMSESYVAAGAAAGIEYRSPSSRLEYRAASTRICYRVPRTARI